jgi:hypothetical protein
MNSQVSDLQFEVCLGSTGSKWAAIWIVLDGTAFPESGWTDFPLTVLRWWVEAALELLHNRVGVVEWRFMDGPFWIEISKLGANNVRLKRQTKAGPQTVQVGTVDVFCMAGQLVRAIRQIGASRGEGRVSCVEIDALLADSRRLEALAPPDLGNLR